MEANSARLVTAEMISILKREALRMGANVFLDEASPSKSYSRKHPGIKLVSFEKKENARRHFNKGVLASGKEQWNQAASHFRKAIEIDPNYKEAYYNLGNALDDTGDLKGAVENYRRAIEIDPKLKEAYYNLGSALDDTGDLKGAVENYRRSIEIDPKLKEAYNNIFILMKAKGSAGELLEVVKFVEG